MVGLIPIKIQYRLANPVLDSIVARVPLWLTNLMLSPANFLNPYRRADIKFISTGKEVSESTSEAL
jgi:hypothetical protein